MIVAVKSAITTSEMLIIYVAREGKSRSCGYRNVDEPPSRARKVARKEAIPRERERERERERDRSSEKRILERGILGYRHRKKGKGESSSDNHRGDGDGDADVDNDVVSTGHSLKRR